MRGSFGIVKGTESSRDFQNKNSRRWFEKINI
jgi:hypothetical protein